MEITPGHIEAPGEHVVLVGPIQGTVTLDDGEIVKVSAEAVVARDEDHAARIADAVGRAYAENGHPTDPDFTYDAPKD
jgi:hypothetical protein